MSDRRLMRTAATTTVETMIAEAGQILENAMRKGLEQRGATVPAMIAEAGRIVERAISEDLATPASQERSAPAHQATNNRPADTNLIAEEGITQSAANSDSVDRARGQVAPPIQQPAAFPETSVPTSPPVTAAAPAQDQGMLGRLRESAGSIFKSFVEKLASLEYKSAAMVPATLGAAVLMTGIGMEAHGVSELRELGGSHLKDYYAMCADQAADSIAEFFVRGIQGDLATFGGNQIAQGLAAGYVTPLIGMASVALARGYASLKGWLNEQQPDNDAISAKLNSVDRGSAFSADDISR